jgi:hypothetical protein
MHWSWYEEGQSRVSLRRLVQRLSPYQYRVWGLSVVLAAMSASMAVYDGWDSLPDS